MSTVSIRYIVHDVDAAIDFYTTYLQFELQMHPNDLFAMLGHGDLRWPSRSDPPVRRAAGRASQPALEHTGLGAGRPEGTGRDQSAHRSFSSRSGYAGEAVAGFLGAGRHW